MSASVIADFISENVFGLSPVFQYRIDESIHLKYYGLILILEFYWFFRRSVQQNHSFLQNQFEKMKCVPKECRVIITFVFAGVFAFTLPEVLGSGHRMIALLNEKHLLFKTVLLLLDFKFIFSIVSFTSGAPGGVFSRYWYWAPISAVPLACLILNGFSYLQN